MKVYFSRSFLARDAVVYNAVREVLRRPSLRNRYDLELFDSEPPSGDQITEKISTDISQADVVVCLFTRRHKIALSGRGKAKRRVRYTVPAFVASEAAYAYALRRRLILLLEDGISPSETGLVGSLNLEHLRFKRGQLKTADFRERLEALCAARLSSGLLSSTPAHSYRKYYVHHTVYPNGYVLTHYKLSVEVNRDEPIRHRFSSEQWEEPKLFPGIQKLLANGSSPAIPYPRRPFLAFASEAGDVRFRAKADSKHLRSFEVGFPETGATYDYQWMWGLPKGFDPRRPLDYHLVSLSTKAVDRVDFRLRIPRKLERRYSARVAHVTSDSKFLEPGAVESLVGELEQRMTHAKLPSRRELTPLHRTFYFHVTPPRATDLLVLF